MVGLVSRRREPSRRSGTAGTAGRGSESPSIACISSARVGAWPGPSGGRSGLRGRPAVWLRMSRTVKSLVSGFLVPGRFLRRRITVKANGLIPGGVATATGGFGVWFLSAFVLLPASAAWGAHAPETDLGRRPRPERRPLGNGLDLDAATWATAFDLDAWARAPTWTASTYAGRRPKRPRVATVIYWPREGTSLGGDCICIIMILPVEASFK